MARTRFVASKPIGLALWLIPLQVILSGCEVEPRRKEAPAPLKHNEAEDVRKYLDLSRPESTVGELVYVPVYSSVVHRGDRGEYFLSSTLSIHNIHLAETVWITAVNYYNTRGQRVRELVNGPIAIRPLHTEQFVIPDGDDTGGTGANYIVKWEAEHDMTSPKIEALMISTQGQQGISFLTHGSLVTRLSRTATSARKATPN